MANANKFRNVLTSYLDVCRFIADRMGSRDWEGDSEYYPFSVGDPNKGFLEVIFPIADSAGRLFRGASGNGPIFIFVYCRGMWTYLGEMHGAKIKADVTTAMTEFTVFAHVSATASIERLYRFKDAEYVCVFEEEISEQ